MPKIENKKRSKEEPAEVRRALARQELEEAEYFSAIFKALGDPTRLRIILFLRDASEPRDAGDGSAPGDDEDDKAEEDALPGGVTVGEIADHLTGSDKVSSNVSHHLKELRHAGLIGMKRRGKNVLCRIEGEALVTLARLLVDPRK